MSEPSPTLPAVHAYHLVELVQRWYVEPDELLEGLDLDEQTMRTPGEKLTLDQYRALVERAIKLTGEPGLAIYFGLNMRISSHGFLGFAAMTSATIREAIEVAVRFIPTLTTTLGLRFVETDELAALVIEEKVDLGYPAREYIMIALSMGIWQIAKATTGVEAKGGADFTFPKPHYSDRFAHIFEGMELRWEQPRTQLVFSPELLDVPLRNADPAALQMAREHCERQMNALGYGKDVVPLVRAALPNDGGGYRSLEEVATELGFSERTLKRRLSARGTSYSSLLDEVRLETAVVLLRGEALSQDQIAERLGYSDASAFGKAFRRWTGMSPAAFNRGPSD